MKYKSSVETVLILDSRLRNLKVTSGNERIEQNSDRIIL